MNDLEIEQKIADIFAAATFPFDRMDAGITLMKMSTPQKTDLWAMTDSLTEQGNEPSFIAAQIGHDLNGLKHEFLNGTSGFSPRSHGYAAKKAI